MTPTARTTALRRHAREALQRSPTGVDTAAVSESRQQRRARERREAKHATRPRPHIQHPAGTPDTSGAPQQRVVEIELNRMVFNDDPADTYVTWHAEWGLRGDDVGIEDSNDDLAELVSSVLQDLRQRAERDTLRLEWELGGDPPTGKTVADAVADGGVQLPHALP